MDSNVLEVTIDRTPKNKKYQRRTATGIGTLLDVLPALDELWILRHGKDTARGAAKDVRPTSNNLV